LLNTNTEFSIKSEESSNSELIIQAHSLPPSDYFMNVMNFSTGELVFDSNFKNEYPDRRSGLNATEVISYQYLGMTKIAGALNMLPKTMLQQNITNPSTNVAMEIYRADRNYPNFYRLALCLVVRFNHSADSLALIIINIVLCGVGFVCFSKFI
jgi:hypothetical protein